MDYAMLQSAVEGHAALRRRQRLQPSGGPGDKIFPPTYPDEANKKGSKALPMHLLEWRRRDGQDVPCCLVDSVQSQANRMEDAIQAGINEGHYEVPHLVVDFTGKGVEPITRITSLQAPHRVYDAILRDTTLHDPTLGEQSFNETDVGKATARDVRPILQYSPSSLVLGAWNSTGQGGGLGDRFQRALVSEIIAVGVSAHTDAGRSFLRNNGRRPSSRMDPLGIRNTVKIHSVNDGWDLVQSESGGKPKGLKPSEINHGNIAPTISELGITCDLLEQSSVLSFAALRRLRFGDAAPETMTAARAYLAALGLLKITELELTGYALRSRCDLVPDGRAPWELIAADGAVESVRLEPQAVRDLYKRALTVLLPHIPLHLDPVTLSPKPNLIALINESRKHARLGVDEETPAKSS